MLYGSEGRYQHFVQSTDGKMTNQYPSTSAAPSQCCEYHDKKSAKKCKTKEKHHVLHMPTIHEIRKKPWGSHCGVILYIVLAVVLVLVALVEVVVTAGSSILTKDLDTDLTGRRVGIVLLAVCAAVTLVAVCSAFYAVNKKDHKALNVMSAIMAIMVIVQILVLVFAVSIKKTDKATLESTLADSFVLAASKREEVSVKMWDSMQSRLKCCGLSGPEDYLDPLSPFLPAKIPFSCCPNSHKNESQFFMKWHRDLCVINKSYYTEGCSDTVLAVFKKTVEYVSITSLVLILLEVLLSGVGVYLVKKSAPLLSKNPQPVTSDNSEDPK